jgi:hypothetical protein
MPTEIPFRLAGGAQPLLLLPVRVEGAGHPAKPLILLLRLA